MSYVEEHLIAGESVVYSAKLNWILFLWPAIFVIIALLSFRSVGGYFFALGLLWGLSSYIRYTSSEFAVTTRRVLIKVGFIRRHSLEILLSKVEGIGVNQGIFGRIFGYGTIVVTGTGGTKEPFSDIARPFEFRKAVQEQTASADVEVRRVS